MEGIGKPTARLARFLTDDEIITVPSRCGENIPFRVRVWKGKNATPVVLASPARTSGGAMSFPSVYASKIANHALSGLAGYPDSNILFYEYDNPIVDECEPQLHQVLFEYYGRCPRLRMFRPMVRLTDWIDFEWMLGTRVER